MKCFCLTFEDLESVFQEMFAHYDLLISVNHSDPFTREVLYVCGSGWMRQRPESNKGSKDKQPTILGFLFT